MPTPDNHDDDLVPIKLPSGATSTCYEREQLYVNDRVTKYLEDFKFTNVSDLADLDRVVMLELLSWRYATWLSQQMDYWRDPVDEKVLSVQLKDIDTQLKAIKTALGIDKVTRDKTSGAGSVAEYIENLRVRASLFGIRRNKEAELATTLFRTLKGKVTFHLNCTEEERKEFKAELTDILEWLVEEAFPEFDEIDRKFRQEGPEAQRLWIRQM